MLLDELFYNYSRGLWGPNHVPAFIGDTDSDSLDATNSFSLKFYMPSETVKVLRFTLRFWLLPFRAYSKTAAAGGGQTKTSGASSSTTTAAGGASTPTSSSGGATTSSTWGAATTGGAAIISTVTGVSTGSGGTGSTGAGTSHVHSITGTQWLTETVSGHAHNYYKGTPDNTGSEATHTHSGPSHSHTVPDHSHTDSGHAHMVEDHSHTIGNHTHTVSISDHSHGMSHTHNVTVDDHTHTAVYGIYESTSATGVTVTINGVDRTAALGGGTGFTTDQTDLDITAYVTYPEAENTITLTSTQLGRIRVQYDGIYLMSLPK